MTKKEAKQIELYWNKNYKDRQIDIYDYDKAMIDSKGIVMFVAKILTDRSLKIPKYIKVSEVSIQNKEIIFYMSVKTIVDVLFLEEPLKDWYVPGTFYYTWTVFNTVQPYIALYCPAWRKFSTLFRKLSTWLRKFSISLNKRTMVVTRKEGLDKMALQHKNIMVLSKPSSGKTTFAKKLIDRLQNHKLIHTDNYINGGFLDLTREIKESKKKVLIEGNLGYELLANDYKPDVIINLLIGDEEMRQNYIKASKHNSLAIARDYAKIDELKFMQYVLNKNNQSKVFTVEGGKHLWKLL